MMNPIRGHERLSVWSRVVSWPWRAGCIGILVAGLATARDGVGETTGLPRFEARFDDGSRMSASRLSDWSASELSFQLDERVVTAGSPAVLWVRDRASSSGPPPDCWIETWTGDRLPGDVVEHVASDDFPYRAQPSHLVVRSQTVSRPPELHPHAPIRVVTRAVRRIVWRRVLSRYQPGTAVLRDGRQLSFRAIRWQGRSATVLTEQGPQTLPLETLAELNLPLVDLWNAYFDELSTVVTDPQEWLLQVEAAHGLIVTTSWQRQRVLTPTGSEYADNWVHGLQPGWSLDVIWLPGLEIATRRFFAAGDVPLSRLMPSRVVQRSALARQGQPWQRDRNVEGSVLRCGQENFGWGFGVHASNQLHFPLPGVTSRLRCDVGLDAAAGPGGCIQARVLLEEPGRQQVFESPVIVGTGRPVAVDLPPFPLDVARRLVLEIDAAHDTRPRGADPFDIRDSADWLDPLLRLDRQQLAQTMARDHVPRVVAWTHWQRAGDPSARLEFHHVWDELSDSVAAFRLAVRVVQGPPLRLRQTCRLGPQDRFLVVVVSCPRPAPDPVRLRITANQVPLFDGDVPILDRQHVHLSPIVVPLQPLVDSAGGPVEFEIQQSPGPAESPVEWHAIHIAARDPTTDGSFDPPPP